MRLPTLQKVRMMWGLTWEGSTLPINLRLVVDGLVFVFVMFAVYFLVDYIAANAELSSKAAAAEHRAKQSESALIACMNGAPLVDTKNNGAVMCDPAKWVAL